MLALHVLASGSKGNAAVVEDLATEPHPNSWTGLIRSG